MQIEPAFGKPAAEWFRKSSTVFREAGSLLHGSAAYSNLLWSSVCMKLPRLAQSFVESFSRSATNQVGKIRPRASGQPIRRGDEFGCQRHPPSVRLNISPFDHHLARHRTRLTENGQVCTLTGMSRLCAINQITPRSRVAKSLVRSNHRLSINRGDEPYLVARLRSLQRVKVSPHFRWRLLGKCPC